MYAAISTSNFCGFWNCYLYVHPSHIFGTIKFYRVLFISCALSQQLHVLSRLFNFNTGQTCTHVCTILCMHMYIRTYVTYKLRTLLSGTVLLLYAVTMDLSSSALPVFMAVWDVPLPTCLLYLCHQTEYLRQVTTAPSHVCTYLSLCVCLSLPVCLSVCLSVYHFFMNQATNSLCSCASSKHENIK